MGYGSPSGVPWGEGLGTGGLESGWGADQGAYYTLMLDGSDYFHSTRLQCPSCLQRQDSSGQVHFRHTVVSGTLVKAGSHRVLP
jgi:hypothetical protein